MDILVHIILHMIYLQSDKHPYILYHIRIKANGHLPFAEIKNGGNAPSIFYSSFANFS